MVDQRLQRIATALRQQFHLSPKAPSNSNAAYAAAKAAAEAWTLALADGLDQAEARKLAAQGKTILLSSHVMEVVEKICSRVVILSKGRVAADDSIERLRELMRLLAKTKASAHKSAQGKT